jgi:hypothetical protein
MIRRQSLVGGLAAAAIFYQGLVPAGYMAGTRADLAEGALVVPCPAQNELVIGTGSDASMAGHAHHHDGAAHAHHHALSGSHSCAFAVAAAVALPGGHSTPPAVPLPVEAPVSRLAADFRAVHRHRLPPVRGPPVYS